MLSMTHSVSGKNNFTIEVLLKSRSRSEVRSELLRALMFKVLAFLRSRWSVNRLGRVPSASESSPLCDCCGGKSRDSSDVGPVSRATSVSTTNLNIPKHGGAVPGGPAHDEAPVRMGAPLAHLVHAARRPHLAHAHLQLLLEVVGRPWSKRFHTISLNGSQQNPTVPEHNTNLLGFGNHQNVGEQEEVPVLGLHAGLELGLSVQEEGPVGASQQGLDQRASLRANGNQEALSGTQTRSFIS